MCIKCKFENRSQCVYGTSTIFPPKNRRRLCEKRREDGFWKTETRKTRSGHMTEWSTVGRITFLQHVAIYKTNVDSSFISILWGAESGIECGGASRAARCLSRWSVLCVRWTEGVEYTGSGTVASFKTDDETAVWERETQSELSWTIHGNGLQTVCLKAKSDISAL